jgi:hypothetical protein
VAPYICGERIPGIFAPDIRSVIYINAIEIQRKGGGGQLKDSCHVETVVESIRGLGLERGPIPAVPLLLAEHYSHSFYM